MYYRVQFKEYNIWQNIWQNLDSLEAGLKLFRQTILDYDRYDIRLVKGYDLEESGKMRVFEVVQYRTSKKQ